MEDEHKTELRAIYVKCIKSDVRVNNIMGRARPLNISQLLIYTMPQKLWWKLCPDICRALKNVKPKAAAKQPAKPSSSSAKKRPKSKTGKSGEEAGTEPASSVKKPKKAKNKK